jgi:hypothetical protein
MNFKSDEWGHRIPVGYALQFFVRLSIDNSEASLGAGIAVVTLDLATLSESLEIRELSGQKEASSALPLVQVRRFLLK